MYFATALFEATSTLLFLAVVAHCLRHKQYRSVACILSGSLFGLVLEFMNVILFDTYSYSSLFLLQVFSPPYNVPLCIGLSWGVIIFSCMRISDKFGLPEWTRPFLDALLALSIDLSMDTIAVRLDGGFWRWTGIPMESAFSMNGFYGVHYGNFVGWFLVVLIFSALVRFEAKILHGRYRISPLVQGFYFLTLPIIAYYILYNAMVLSPLPIYIVNDLLFGLDLEANIQPMCVCILGYLCLVSIAIQVVAYLKVRPAQKSDVDWISTAVFSFFHVTFLFLYMSEGYFSEVPTLLPVGIALFALDGLVHWMILDKQKAAVLFSSAFSTLRAATFVGILGGSERKQQEA